MTDAEMTEAVRRASYYLEIGSGCHGCRQLAGRYGGERCGPCLVALALLESRRQVEALTKERDEARQMCRIQFIDEEGRRCVRFVDAAAVVAERDAATARAERAERERDDAIRTAVDHQRINNSLTVKLDEYLTGRKVTAMLATERACVVEAIAAWHDKASGIDSSHGNSFQAFAHALSADHIRSHNWAPPEEDGK